MNDSKGINSELLLQITGGKVVAWTLVVDVEMVRKVDS